MTDFGVPALELDALPCDFGTSDTVWHCSYFRQDKTINYLSEKLKLGIDLSGVRTRLWRPSAVRRVVMVEAVPIQPKLRERYFTRGGSRSSVSTMPAEHMAMTVPSFGAIL